MPYDIIESTELDSSHGRDEITISEDRHGEYWLVFDGPGGAEMTIAFSDVEEKRNRIEFYYSPYTSGRDESKVAQIEGDFESLDDVGIWLEQFAYDGGNRP